MICFMVSILRYVCKSTPNVIETVEQKNKRQQEIDLLINGFDIPNRDELIAKHFKWVKNETTICK